MRQKVHIWHWTRCRLKAGLPQIAPSPPRLPACKKGQNLGFSPSLTPIWETTVKILQYTLKILFTEIIGVCLAWKPSRASEVDHFSHKQCTQRSSPTLYLFELYLRRKRRQIKRCGKQRSCTYKYIFRNTY